MLQFIYWLPFIYVHAKQCGFMMLIKYFHVCSTCFVFLVSVICPGHESIGRKIAKLWTDTISENGRHSVKRGWLLNDQHLRQSETSCRISGRLDGWLPVVLEGQWLSIRRKAAFDKRFRLDGIVLPLSRGSNLGIVRLFVGNNIEIVDMYDALQATRDVPNSSD